MLKDTDFMFASARIRAAESKGTPKERLDQLLEATDLAQLRAIVADWTGSDPDLSLDELLDRSLVSAVSLMQEAVPDLTAYRFLLNKYDCCNIKIAIKNAVGESRFDDVYFSVGTVPAEKIKEMPLTGDYSLLPTHMATAAPEALAAYKQTGEGRGIDLLLDKACFADSADSAAETAVPFLMEWNALKSDTVNLLSSLRISRMKMPVDTALALFRRAFVSGGSIAEEAFFNAEEGLLPLEKVALSIAASDLRAAAVQAGSVGSNALAEHILDDVADKRIAAIRQLPFGPEVPALFLLIREAEIRNVRLIAAGLAAGLTRDQIKERVRVFYV